MHSEIISIDESARLESRKKWDYFKEFWYARSDGSVVPIWGGVPWMNNRRRRVKGKLRSKRPGGRKRYKQGDALMQSTGILRGALLADFNVTQNQISMETPVPYAGYQNVLRPWNYFTDEDAGKVASIICRQMK
jgi:hypothetical protein